MITLLSRPQIEEALRRLGELALDHDESIELMVVGGAAMVLAYDARLATHDVDAVLLNPGQTHFVRGMVKRVAEELDWPTDWLNDGAKGFLVGVSDGGTIFSAPGIVVRCPAPAQLLAMKLSAWRDDVDIQDAGRILLELVKKEGENQDRLWVLIEPFLIRGQELKARYAFLDLWESTHDND